MNLLQKLRELRPRKFLSAIKVIRLLKNWPDYFKEFLGLKKGKETLYILRSGHKLLLKEHAINTRVFNEIWVYECYNPPGFKINPEDTVLDIGANYGNFTLYAALKARNGKVYAFEPFKEVNKILEKNISINRLNNVKLIKKAVSNKSGSRDFYIAKKDNVSHSFFESNVSDVKEKIDNIKVKTISLKDFLSQEKIKKVDFLKMDCEGAEYEILFSSEKALKAIDKISMETHYVDEKRNVIALKSFLEKNGFDVSIDPNRETNFINLLYAKKRRLN